MGWKIFGASVRANVVVHVDPDAVITVKRLRLRSGNPVVAIGLRMTRGELRALEGSRHDLNAGLGELRVSDLRVSAGEDIEVSCRIR